jgi:hypothetical protein
MKIIIQIARIFGVALMLAALLSVTSESARRVHAGCGAGVGWGISSVQTSSQTTHTQDYSSTSVQISDDGQTFTDHQSSHTNADGSSSSHEDMDYNDQYGNSCNSDGGPMSGHVTRDEETDKDGNRKEHYEEIIEKDGKCEKTVRDREWDRKGKLVKDTGFITTEIPCSRYNLEWDRKGNISMGGGHTVQFESFTVTVPLRAKGGAFEARTYEGNYQVNSRVTLTGKCSGTYAQPVSIEVTAKEDEFDLELLHFSVKISLSLTGMTQCPEGSGMANSGTQTVTHDFTLHIEDKPTEVWQPLPGTDYTYTFTIKKRNP